MWTAVRKEVGLAIGFPDLNCGEDEYFGERVHEYCRKFGKKIVYIDDLLPEHRHRSNLKGFLKARWKYGQSAVLLRFVNKRVTLPLALVALLVVFLWLFFFVRGFFVPCFFGLVGAFLLTKTKLWRWAWKNYGPKVMMGCMMLTVFGGLVSLMSMYYGLIKAVKKVKVYRYPL